MREELFIHQYNFADWMPSSIRSLAVDKYSDLIAVGRQDGEIELIGPNYKWYTQARISGKSNLDLSGLVFSHSEEESGRLFGATLQGYIFEVDFSSLTLKNIRDSYGGTVWALAVSKRDSILGLGCEDGTVKLFNFANSQLDYQKSMSATGSRILSVAFHPIDARVYAGCADGTIRCFNETTGSNIFRIVGDVQKGVICSIWSLIVLKDFTLVSGDNHGRVQFWNGYSGNELLSTSQQHTSTILCLVTNDKEDAIFASGEDSRVICLRRLNSTRESLPSSLFPSSSAEQKRTPHLESMLNCQWIYTSSHRPHSHDVRSLVITTQRGAQPKSVLVSGGVDSKLCMYSVDDFTGTRPTWVLPIPARGITAASSDSQLLAVKHRTHLDLWFLNHPNIPTLNDHSSNNSNNSNGNGNGVKLSIDKSTIGCTLSSRIQLKDGVSRDYFHSIALTSDGELLAATGGGAHESESLDSLSGLRLWHLTRGSQVNEIVAVKVQLSADILELLVDDAVCQSLAFSSDGSSLCVTVSGSDSVKLVLLDIKKPTQNDDHQYHVSIRHVINHSRQVKARRQQQQQVLLLQQQQQQHSPHHILDAIIDKLSLSISSLSYSADGRWLGVCSCEKLIFIYEIDRLSLHWSLPTFDSPISCFAFHPQSPNYLITVLAGDNSFQIFDVQDKILSPWSIENKDLIPSWASSLGKAASGPVMNISFDPSCIRAFVMHGQAFSVYINLDRPIPSIFNPTSNSSSTTTTSSSSSSSSLVASPSLAPSEAFSHQIVTHSMLTSPSNDQQPSNKFEYLQKELNELKPTDRKYLKKKKKLERLLEEESASAAAETAEVVAKKSKKSRKNEEIEELNGGSKKHEMRNFSILQSHRSIVHLSILNSNEMVIVENPWVRILENLPETLARKRYGA